MNRNVSIRSRLSNRTFQLLCVIAVLPCTGTDAAEQPANAAPQTSTAPATGAPSPASQPRKSQPLNWGSLNPQPLPPSPPDPSRSFLGPPNTMGQRGIIIIGGKPIIGSSGASPNPSVSAPATPLAPPTALGTAQTSQRPLTAPPAGTVSNRRGALGVAGAQGKSNRPAVVPISPSSKKLKFAPLRASLLVQEAAARDAENGIAQSIRLHATDAVDAVGSSPSPTRPILLTPAGASAANTTTGAARNALQRTAPALRIGKTPLSWKPGAGQSRSVPASVAPAMAMAEAQRPQMQAVGQRALHLPPGIWFVNNEESGFVVIPGGYVTIQGKGFGETQGTVNLVLNTTQRRLPFRIIDWHDDEVHALLPLDISGVPDQLATLQLITRPRMTYQTTYTVDNAKFHALRAEITLTSNLDRLIEMSSASNWPATSAVRGDGLVMREENGTSIDCKAPGTDSLYFKPPAGWEVSGVEASFGRTDTGDGDGYGNNGSRVFTPGYDLGDWARSSVPGTARWMIPVQWGVWRSHRSPSAGVADFIPYQIASVASYVVQIPGGKGSQDVCESDYRIAVHLIGPAGMSPY